MKLTFEIVTWPEIQEYMEKDGFRENACLANDEHFVNVFGSSAYFVNSKWKDDIDSMKQLPIKEVKQVHAGQYRPYGDTFDVWEIYLEEGESFDREDALVFCFTELSRRKVQSKQEWNANHGNADAYFSGYYELEKTSYGYKFTVCSPYTDLAMKLLNCPCENAVYCGTMISSMKLHKFMYREKFRSFIHSRKGLTYLLSNYDKKTEVLEAIKDAYIKLR